MCGREGKRENTHVGEFVIVLGRVSPGRRHPQEAIRQSPVVWRDLS